MEDATNTYLKDVSFYTGANIWTELWDELHLEKRILEEQGEVITYSLNDLDR